MKQTTRATMAVGITLALVITLIPRLDEPREAGGKRPDRPDHAAQWLALRRATTDGTAASRKNMRAVEQVRARAATRGTSSLPNLRIEEFGPGNFGGRVRGIVVHPTQPDRILIGGVLGGVWRTDDGGVTWTPSDDFMSNLAISCLAYDPVDPETVYAGTGEGFFNIDAASGAGIFVSTDFGVTWSLLPATDSDDFVYVNRMGITGSGALMAAARAGLFRSTDDGASWTEVNPTATEGRGFVDLKVDPSDQARIFAFHYGNDDGSNRIWRSEDDGISWTELDNDQGLPVTSIGRMELAIGGDGVVYVSVADGGGGNRGLWRSPAGGDAFTKAGSKEPYIERQGWYNLAVGVDPTDSDRVYLGAVELFRSTDGGETITRQSVWNPGEGAADLYVHADIHNLVFHPDDPMTLFIATDGGIFKSTDGGERFSDLNNNLRITQYYGFDVGPQGQGVAGGTQDNGTNLYYGDEVFWLKYATGDGTTAAWDRQKPGIIYGAWPYGDLFVSPNRGRILEAVEVPTRTGAQYVTPFVLDPKDGNRFMIGMDRVYFTDDIRHYRSVTWTDLGALSNSVNALSFDPHDPDRAWAGDIMGGIGRITGLTGTPNIEMVDLDLSGPVTGIEIDPSDPTGMTVYASFATYRPDRIVRTVDGGNTWTSIHGDLPEIPVFDVTVDPDNPDRLYAATEIGLFTTLITGRGAIAWEHFDHGIAWTRVMQLCWRNQELWAATHGRGIYRLTPDPVTPTLTAISDDGCVGDGILDRGERAELEIAVTNESGVPLTGLELTVSSEHPDLITIDDQVMIASIAPGATATASIGVTLLEGAECRGEAVLSVTSSHDAGSQVDTLVLPVASNRVYLTGTFTEDGEDDDTLFTHSVLRGYDYWHRETDFAHSGNGSWSTHHDWLLMDSSLFSPWLEVQSPSATLSFWIYYSSDAFMNQPFDGTTLQIRRRGGDWRSIETSLPYDGRYRQFRLLEFEPAWSGRDETWRHATVSLADHTGDEIQFRFRAATSGYSQSPSGFFVDDIAVTDVGWWTAYTCDVLVCRRCFDDARDALSHVLDIVGAGAWPRRYSMTDAVEHVNRICE